MYKHWLLKSSSQTVVSPSKSAVLRDPTTRKEVLGSLSLLKFKKDFHLSDRLIMNATIKSLKSKYTGELHGLHRDLFMKLCKPRMSNIDRLLK
jgi:hypothetical protein